MFNVITLIVILLRCASVNLLTEAPTTTTVGPPEDLDCYNSIAISIMIIYNYIFAIIIVNGLLDVRPIIRIPTVILSPIIAPVVIGYHYYRKYKYKSLNRSSEFELII